MTSPEASFGSQCCFCSSVPPPISALARISGRVISEPAAASEARESSSVVRIMARLPISTPPYSSGIERPKKPSSAIFSMNYSGIDARRCDGCARHAGATSLRGELAHLVAHLLVHLVERRVVARRRLGTPRADLAQQRLGGGAAERPRARQRERPSRPLRRRCRDRRRPSASRSRRVLMRSPTAAIAIILAHRRSLCPRPTGVELGRASRGRRRPRWRHRRRAR